MSPHDRFAAVIARHHVTILKAGSTFLRMAMTARIEPLLAKHELRSLRLGTFCAEPVNEAVHAFAATHLTPYYINSYWATEHGGIVWSRCHNAQTPLRPDTRAWPLPWIGGDVMVLAQQRADEADDASADDTHTRPAEWRRAADGESGEIVIRAAYPYMALTVWSSKGYGEASWRGDLHRWRGYFGSTVGYMQGDVAVRHADGAYTFHGRSDEVRLPTAHGAFPHGRGALSSLRRRPSA